MAAPARALIAGTTALASWRTGAKRGWSWGRLVRNGAVATWNVKESVARIVSSARSLSA